jgi:MOSC domain
MTIDDREAPSVGSVVSVNVGEPREVEWAGRRVRTAIWKTPTEGRVPVERDNLLGDAQADLRVHGGPDKAVYAYASEDYRWWEGQLGAPLDPGTFGENLTTEGVELDSAVIGEVWQSVLRFSKWLRPGSPASNWGSGWATPGSCRSSTAPVALASISVSKWSVRSPRVMRSSDWPGPPTG